MLTSSGEKAQGEATGRADHGKNRIQEWYKTHSRPENSYLRKRRRSHDVETAKGKPRNAQGDLQSAAHRAFCRGPSEPEPWRVYLEPSRLITVSSQPVPQKEPFPLLSLQIQKSTLWQLSI